jgi:predicted outer membrane protein
MTRFIAALWGLGLASVLIVAPAHAAQDAEDFIKQAIRGNIAEVQMGELAKDMNVDPPTKPSEEAQETYDRLAKLSGDKFDREFISVAVKDHKKDIEAYSKQAKSGDNKKVAEYADETLPILKKHLDMAQKLESNMER